MIHSPVTYPLNHDTSIIVGSFRLSKLVCLSLTNLQLKSKIFITLPSFCNCLSMWTIDLSQFIRLENVTYESLHLKVFNKGPEFNQSTFHSWVKKKKNQTYEGMNNLVVNCKTLQDNAWCTCLWKALRKAVVKFIRSCSFSSDHWNEGSYLYILLEYWNTVSVLIMYKISTFCWHPR